MTIPDLIPALPLDLALDCLQRVPLRSHSTLQQVCRSWRSLLATPHFYRARQQKGYTDTHACIIQALPHSSSPGKSPAYGISMYDTKLEAWDTLPLIPDFPHGLPLFAGSIAVGPNIVVLGGWDPTSWAVLTSVYIYNFSLGEWRRGADMLSARSFFACGSIIVDTSDGSDYGIKIIVAGGHDVNKNALKSAEIYDLGKDEWDVLPDMQQERDECKGALMGGQFMVISGFSTESQGQFLRSAETFNMGERRWEMVDNVWPGARPPSSTVAFKGQLYALWDSKLMRWKQSEETWEPVLTLSPGVKVPTCVTPLQNGILIVGYSGGAQPYETFLCRVGTGSNPATWSSVRSGACCGIVQGTACTVHV